MTASKRLDTLFPTLAEIPEAYRPDAPIEQREYLVDGQLRASGDITGLKPDSEHGFHIHEKGDCSSGDGMSTGGHFNPGGKSHGHHGMGDHHTGDLPSLKADANGVASFSFESRTIRVGSTANDIVGKGLIVHRDPDDYKTQPTGNAGPRLACAVIAAKS